MVTLNRKKKTITIDQGDQSSVILSYTPYVTREYLLKLYIMTCKLILQITVLLEFHDFMSTQPDSAEVDLGEQEEFWPLLVMLGQERCVHHHSEKVNLI